MESLQKGNFYWWNFSFQRTVERLGLNLNLREILHVDWLMNVV